MLRLEFILALAVIIIGIAAPKLGSSWFSAFEYRFGLLARKRRTAVVVAGLAGIVLRLALLPVLPVPSPSNPDEFGHLLVADTLAHGRVANPTPPMWVHFESLHINQVPTYSSMMFPGQGLILAAGERLGGHPFVGVVLSLGLMCASLCWMLQAWVPEPWALMGALLVAVRFGTFSYWGDSYMGGALAACGAALVLGAAPRILRSRRVLDSVLLGIGLGILANTRPFEGLFISAPVIVWLLYELTFKKHADARTIARVLLPLATIVILFAASMVYYNWRTTSHALQTPYIQNIKTYNPVPYFPWQAARTSQHYRHVVMQKFYAAFMGPYSFAREHPLYLAISKVILLWCFFIGPVFSLPLVIGGKAAWKLVRTPDYRLLGFTLCAGLIALALPVYFFPHYAAPLMPAIFALMLVAMRETRRLQWRGRPVGLFVSRAVPAVIVAMLLAACFAPRLGIPMPQPWPQHLAIWCSNLRQFSQRSDLLQKLKSLPGKQLVIVHYAPNHDNVQEWVYNDADLEHAPVVWAREMTPAENNDLVKYFSDRAAWLLEADENPPKLSPYPSASRLVVTASIGGSSR